MKLEFANGATMYIYLADFPNKNGKVVFKTVQARDDNMVLVNLDYDKKGKLIGIEIIENEMEGMK